ncbi:MAG: hypothetical protein EBT05_13395 [Betaproteobacteria bacterium]|nr:hypothetical protein [Betaproteobacteria bacterium]
MSETNISKVGICGSGIMGSGLAEVAAKAGYTVVVRSRSAASAQAMITSIEKGLDVHQARPFACRRGVFQRTGLAADPAPG